MNLKLIVFDVGGTIIEDAGHVPAAFEATLRAHGLPVSSSAIADWRGASKREVIRRLVDQRDGRDDDLSERIYRGFREHLVGLFKDRGVRPVAGIEQALAALKSADLRLAATTGFDREITAEVLAGLGWREILDAVVCSDDVTAGRPAPYMIFRAMESAGIASVHQVANVGDTTNDLRAGYSAGVAANVGVLTGAHSRARLLRAPHTHILASAAQVPEALIADD